MDVLLLGGQDVDPCLAVYRGLVWQQITINSQLPYQAQYSKPLGIETFCGTLLGDEPLD